MHNNQQDYKWLYPKSRQKERIRARWLEHLQRMNDTKISKQAFSYTRKGRQENVRPKKKWIAEARTESVFFYPDVKMFVMMIMILLH